MEYFDPASKKHGLSHLVAATRYSIAGFRIAFRESAFRHELLAAAAILVIYAMIGAGPLAWLGSMTLFLLTLAVEAINTAIELVVDRTSPEISQFGKDAKDLGSFSVFCLLAANGIFFAWVLWTTLFAAAA